MQVCTLVTMDIMGAAGTKVLCGPSRAHLCCTVLPQVRSYYAANNVTDVALYTEPEEIYLMKKNGTVVLYDATSKSETVKISNSNSLCSPAIAGDSSDYQLFVNGKEQICVMQVCFIQLYVLHWYCTV